MSSSGIKPVSPVFGYGVKPRFGFAPAPALLSAMDFAQLGTSTVMQNKWIYGLVIASRVGASREATERWENLRRDPLGWYSWFMGSPLLQVAMAAAGLPLVSPGSRELMVNYLNKNASPARKFFWTLFNPSKLWLLASDKQLEQRKTQLINALVKANRHKEIEAVEKLFSKTITLRGIMSLIGLAFTIALLGVGINLLNIAMTKAAVSKDKGKPQPYQGHRFSGIPAPTAAAGRPAAGAGLFAGRARGVPAYFGIHPAGQVNPFAARYANSYPASVPAQGHIR